MATFSFEQVIAISFAASFLTSYFVTPFIMRNSANAGIFGWDRNKKGIRLPEMGGIAIVAGISIGMLSSIATGFYSELDIKVLLAAISTVVIMGILGIIDDIYSLQKKVKAPIPFIASIPLSAVRAGARNIHVPVLGTLNFGSLYPLALVPLGVGGASNAFNMLAGLNGLEAGMGLIISSALFLAAFMKGAMEAMIISACLASACLAFLYYNRYPARIFPGDVGTYTIGATIASATIVGNLEFFGLFLFLPYFVEFVLKARTRFQGQSFGILKGGKLHPPARISSLTHVFMKLAPMSEDGVVKCILLTESAIAVIGLLLLAI